jgi:hypothetical protein
VNVFNNRIFNGWNEFDSGRTHCDVRFTHCTFQSCSLALSERDLAKRARVVNAELRQCSIAACGVTAVVFEDVLVDGLRTSSLFQTWAAVFKHVTLKGKIDRVMFSPFFHPGYYKSQFQRVVSEANASYYAGVDWALDIREAEFKDFDCRGVPSRLVKRDPETQIMVTRERVLKCGDAIRAGGPFWESWLKLFVEDGWYEDGVLVVPKRSSKRHELAAGLQQLRRYGVAEVD